MKVIRTAAELGQAKACLAIGFFDGVHLGHQQILRQTIADARQQEAAALVLTFDQHPSAVVAPAKAPPLLYPLRQKLRVIESLGADALLLIHFDAAFSRQEAEPFIRELARDLGQIRSICVGANFAFGARRAGNVELLQQLGASLNFAVHGMASVALDGTTVSSTRIRQAVQNGNLDLAGQMLGRAYALMGQVVPGDRLGRQLGFPTANLDVAGLALPPTGVYAAHAQLDGRAWRAVLNLGFRPTLGDPHPPLRAEAHLLGFDGDLYGRDLEVIPLARLREERKFGSLPELKEQIARDIAAAQDRF